MKMKTVATWCAIFVLGVAIGRLLPRVAKEEPMVDDGRSASQHRATTPARLDERLWESATKSRNRAASPASDASTSSQADPGFDEVLVPTALIGELSAAAGVRTLDQELFTRDGRIEEALGITEREKAMIQTSWRAVRQKIRDIEAASMTTEDIDDWTVRITVPDLATSIRPLAGEFRSEVSQALGGDRSKAFLAAKQIDTVFSPPVGERTYEVTSESVGDGQWRFRMNLSGPEGNRVWVGDTIPEEIRHLTVDFKH